jgi:hypothetical protein
MEVIYGLNFNWRMDSDGLQVGRPVFDSRDRQEIFFSSTAVRPTQPGPEVDLSYSSIAEVKNGEAIFSLHHLFSWSSA